MTEMTSRERMLAALRREDVDRVPVPQRFWVHPPKEEAFVFDGPEGQIAWAKERGFDPYLEMPLPVTGTPDVRQRVWTESDPDETVPILCSEWTSPRGTMTSKLRKTEDYRSDGVEFFDDFNTPRYTKPLLSSGEDMMTFVAMDPFRIEDGDGLGRWRQECERMKAIAAREGVAICAYGGRALDYLLHGSTGEGAVMLVLDYPEETMALLKYLNGVRSRALELCLEAGADFVIRRGWYDSTDFWSPDIFSRFAAPFVRNTVKLSHQAGLPCCYVMCTGIMPLLSELDELDFDCLMGIEPVCTGQDMHRIVEALGGRKSFWTGLSAPLHIGMGSTEDVRKAVRLAFDTFGSQGLLLSAVPSIRRHWPWENVQAMMEEYENAVSQLTK